jgi:hypothetical protein
MNILLTAIQTFLKAELTYVKGVVIVPDFFIFPVEQGFPLIGLLDNGEDPLAGEKAGRLGRLKVSIGFYQAIAKVEASVIGDGRNKGVIEIAKDTFDALEDETFDFAYSPPALMRKSKTQALGNPDYKGFLAFKSIDLEYTNQGARST